MILKTVLNSVLKFPDKTSINNIFRRYGSMLVKCEKHNIIPDVILETPATPLYVYFDRSGANLDFGNQLTPTETILSPSVSWNAKDKKLYTLIMVDPDVPSRSDPHLREFLHWHIVNIPSNDLKGGKCLAQYVGPCPAETSGLHRYVLMVFEQEMRILSDFQDCIKSNNGSERVMFNTRQFAEEQLLTGPIAINYFLAKYDISCDKIWKQLGLADLKRRITEYHVQTSKIL